MVSNKDAAQASASSAMASSTSAESYSIASAASADAAASEALEATAATLLTAADVVTTNATAASIVVDSAAIEAAKVAAEASATASGVFSATAQTSALEAAASELAASVSESTASQSALNSNISEGNSLTYRDATKTLYDSTVIQAADSSANATAADLSEVAALASKEFSQQWASELEDVAVVDGVNPSGFSAYHWAQKATNIVGGVTDFGDLSDVPASFEGQALKVLRVDSGETSVEFTVLDRANVGLGNVDNTSDANKPISIASAAAIGLKADETVTDSIGIRLTDVEADTTSITNQLSSGNDPDRVQISKVVYSTAPQTLGAVEPEALTRHDLTVAMIAAETIGAY